MSVYGGVNIVDDGLVFNIDFANPKSINGTTLRDISKSKLGTLTFTDLSTHALTDKYVEFTPVNETTASSYWAISNSLFSGLSDNITFETLFYVPAAATGGNRVVSTRYTESAAPVGFGVQSTFFQTECNCVSGWKTGNITPGGSLLNRWLYFTQTVSTSFDQLKTYLNGQYIGAISLAASTPVSSAGISIGRGFYSGVRYGSGRVSFVRYYNRVLSDPEILQNFNALRGRFGI